MRTTAAIVLLVLVASSGCLSGAGDSPGSSSPTVETTETTESTIWTPTPSNKGYLIVEAVREVPEDAVVVNASDERIRNLTLVQQTIKNVTETGRNDTVNVTGERVRRVEKALGELPWYSGRDGPSGNYIRKDDTVVVAYLKVEI